jgi:hypothetical protein
MNNISRQLGGLLKRLKYGPRLRPVRDWLVLLSLFTILLFVSVGWNLWLFSQVTSGNQIGTATSTPAIEIQLGQVKGLFEERAVERTRYTTEYRFVDPSR